LQLRFTSDALDNLADIAEYIAHVSASVTVAEKFTNKLLQKCQSLASLPVQMGRPRPELRPDIRSFPFKAYVIFFRYVDRVFEVVNVLEGHRDIDAYFGGEMDERHREGT
jgi:toxin ParE1/3/4